MSPSPDPRSPLVPEWTQRSIFTGARRTASGNERRSFPLVPEVDVSAEKVPNRLVPDAGTSPGGGWFVPTPFRGWTGTSGPFFVWTTLTLVASAALIALALGGA